MPCHLISDMHEWIDETTTKGIDLTKSTGKEDLVDLDSSPTLCND